MGLLAAKVLGAGKKYENDFHAAAKKENGKYTTKQNTFN